MFLMDEKITKLIQNGSLNLRVNMSWAVIVNTYGISPIRLNISSIRKIAISILIFLMLFEFMIEAFSSPSIEINLLFNKLKNRLLNSDSFNLAGTSIIIIMIV